MEAHLAVSDWSTTAGSNSTVGGINIAEGCPPGNINNAIREMMAQIKSYADALVTVPSGTVLTVARSTPPSGYLECDGSAISRATYAALFTAIGTTYGAGDGSTTFNIPDLRGEFVRGWDHGRGIDSGRAFGSTQSGQNAAHTHTGTTDSNGDHAHNVTVNLNDGSGAFVADSSGGGGTNTTATSTTGAHTHTFTTGSSGGEARPRNVALMHVIKV